MSATSTKESESLFVIRIAGLFTIQDQNAIEAKLRNEIDRNLKTKLLILTEEFKGWDKQGDWGDLSFMYEYDACIDKIAIVTESQWEEQVHMFIGAGRRQAVVELFDVDEEQEARKWLNN